MDSFGPSGLLSLLIGCVQERSATISMYDPAWRFVVVKLMDKTVQSKGAVEKADLKSAAKAARDCANRVFNSTKDPDELPRGVSSHPCSTDTTSVVKRGSFVQRESTVQTVASGGKDRPMTANDGPVEEFIAEVNALEDASTRHLFEDMREEERRSREAADTPSEDPSPRVSYRLTARNGMGGYSVRPSEPHQPVVKQEEKPDSTTYLLGLLSADANTTASTRLLRIVKHEVVGLDTSLGLKLLDLAQALRSDGELSPLPRSVDPAPSVPSFPSVATLSPEMNQLNECSRMLNVIAQAVGVTLIEEDDSEPQPPLASAYPDSDSFGGWSYQTAEYLGPHYARDWYDDFPPPPSSPPYSMGAYRPAAPSAWQSWYDTSR